MGKAKRGRGEVKGGNKLSSAEVTVPSEKKRGT